MTDEPTARGAVQRAQAIVTWIRGFPAGLRWCVLLAAPLLGAIAFVHTFASPMPTTDEWFFTKSIVSLQRFNLHTTDGVEEARRAAPWRFADHWVVVPFLVYWPIAEWTGFDSRWFMYLTLIVFVIEALLLWRFVFDRSAWAFPVALLLLCPSHYMEFLWGWQFTLAFSIVLPLAGLVMVSRMSQEPRAAKQALLLVLGLLLCLLGSLSSAGGFFGFMCVILLLMLEPMRALAKSVWLLLAIVAMVFAYEVLLQDSTERLAIGSQQVWKTLTALGGTVFGTPIGLFHFGLDLYSATGLIIVLCTGFVVRRALLLGVLQKIALALAITMFGILCTAATAMARSVLGNWHLQYALLAVCGGYAAAFRLWRIDRTAYSAVPFFTLFTLLTMCVVGWWSGFTKYGPEYRAYVHRVDDYCRAFLEHPGSPKPFPPTVDVNSSMMLFLSAHHHPVFQDEPGPREMLPLPESARVFLNAKEIGPHAAITVERWKMSLLTVVFPDGIEARVVMGHIGDSDVVLRRIHPIYSTLPCSHEPGAVSFAALIVPRVIGAGVHPMSLSIER